MSIVNLNSVLCVLVFVGPLLAFSAHASESFRGDSSTAADTTGIEDGLRDTFADYSAAYTDIEFVHLQGPDDITAVNALLPFLGKGAQNVDYEHPIEARQALLEAQKERIRLLLANRMPSATLFKTGTGSSFSKPYVCVITLDETVFTAEPLAATRFFSDDMNVNAAAYLDNQEALRFSLDHEIFHCLDAYVNGSPFRMTSSEVIASYDRSRVEQRADYYAALAHRARKGASDRFLKNLARFRTMALVNWDPSHYTTPVLLAALSTDSGTITDIDLRARVRSAMQRADQLVISEDHYWDFIAAAVAVSLTQGRGEGAFSPMFREVVSTNRSTDSTQVARLIAQVREAKRFLSGAQVSRN